MFRHRLRKSAQFLKRVRIAPRFHFNLDILHGSLHSESILTDCVADLAKFLRSGSGRWLSSLER